MGDLESVSGLACIQLSCAVGHCLRTQDGCPCSCRLRTRN